MNNSPNVSLEQFPGLPVGGTPAPFRRLRICIASYDFVGPVRNGGVGTAFTSLGEALARAGHEVTLFYMSGNFCENQTMQHWIAEYRKKGIRFVVMTEETELKLGASPRMAHSYEAYRWLSREPFDVIHFSEWRAPGYYSIVAKKQGLAFQNTVLSVNTHGPTLWSLIGNGEYLTDIEDVELDFMERQCVKLADVVISPSQYLFRWMKQQNWEFATQSYVHQNILPENARSGIHAVDRAPRPVRELVFFGRLELRKGLALLCDALDRLAGETDCRHLKLTFLGKASKINDQDSQQYLQTRSKKWPWRWSIISNLDQYGAMTYMQVEGRLALIPSQTDNLPYTVMECLGAGIAFLASDIGGIPETMLAEDRDRILFQPRASVFAEKILYAVRCGVAPAQFAIQPDATERAWLDWHNGLGSGLNLLSHGSLPDTPMVSVCMSHFNRPDFLRQALDSLRAQDYPNFEVVLVDDASTKPEAIAYINSLEPEFAQRNWQLIRNPEELFVGAARNVAARHARGEYLMFMDDDNVAKPNEISVFVSVARKTNADTVSCCLDFFSTTKPPAPDQLPDQRFLFLGPAISASALRNYLGDTNSLFRRKVFLKLGGFHEERHVGHEDWELLSDAILKGYHHEVVPDALVWYRRLDNGASATSQNWLQRGHMHNIRPYLDAMPPSLRTLILFAQGQVVDAQNSYANKSATAKITYWKSSVRWRVLYETARELHALRQRDAAARHFKSALTAASETNNPFIVLEAMLAVGGEMRVNKYADAQQVLQLAVQLARNLKRHAEADHAQSLLDTITSKPKAAPAAPATENHTKPASAQNDTPPIPSPESSGSPAVSIIIPVFNNLALTKDCLHSLDSNNSAVPHEVIVVNNASTDGTAEFLGEQKRAGRIRLIENPKNEGFARACNQGAQAARGSLLLFLNNDTRVTPGWLDAMVQAASRPQVEIVGAKLLYADNRIQHAGIGFINGVPDHPNRYAPADALEVNKFRELDMVTAACLMVRREVFLQLAGFDEIYRNGVEDIDLCLRVRAAGWKVAYEPKAVVYHLEGQSAGRFNHVNENLRIFFERWGKMFDTQKRFVPPRPAKSMKASRSLLRNPAETVGANTVKVDWIGSFLDHGSLSHVNRELTAAFGSSSGIQLHCVVNRLRQNAGRTDLQVGQDARQRVPTGDSSQQPSSDAAVTVRHAWPPDWKRPAKGKLVVIQPWEFGALPEQWIKDSARVDEFWVPSQFVRNCYIESGVSAEKVFVVPNGVNQEKFHPQVAPMKLATKKKFKFLFVGGTIFRKGPDLLLKAYLENFTAADDVCLVIKDFGGKDVYAGQTFEAKIRAAQSQLNAPEIIYLNEELPADALPGLYAACDCLVLPYRGEGFGLPVLEAMACGLPAIVTAGGATDDFVRDEFAWRIPARRMVFGNEISGLKLIGPGWLLEPDFVALGGFMREAFGNPAETRKRGQLAARHAKQYSWQNAATIAAQRVHAPAKTLLPSSISTAPKPPEGGTPNSKTTITLPPCALIGHLAEARELVHQKKFRAAWDSALVALAKRPFHPEAFLTLAEIAQAVGDGPSARLCAEHARHIAPAWKPAKKFLNQRLKNGARPDWLNPSSILHPLSSPQLSVCLIVRNEERFIGQCLKSVRDIASQIVVVDTGSTDRTVEIAKEFGAEVHSFAWCDDFSAARNAALEHVTGDWVLMLDADEELSPDGHEKLKAAMNNPAVMAWRLPMVDVGREADGVSYVPRMYRNAPALFYVGRVHEQIFSSIEVRRGEWGLENRIGDATLIHHGYTAELVRDRNKIERNLRLLERAISELPDEPHLLMNYGLELARSGRETEALQRYREAYSILSSKPAAEIVPELRETLLMQLCTHLMAAKQFNEIVGVLTSPLARMNGGLTASLHFSLGLAQLELKRFSEAADQMRQCLAKRHQRCLAPINKEIMTSAPHHCLGLCLAHSGDASAADKAFQNGLTETGHGDRLRLDYARFLAGQNRPVEALQQLHEIVAANARHVEAWRLGGQFALSRPEFLEFARDWTKEAMLHVQDDLTVTAHRAEALMLSGDTTAAIGLWEKIWNESPQPPALAALIVCETVESSTTHAPSNAAEEVAASRAFIGWYQKLIAAKAHQTVGRLNEQTDKLTRALPGAARILEAAIAEADRKTAIGA